MLIPIPPPTRPVPTLTPRMSEVLRMIALGMTNREIGRELHLTEQTVKVHAGRLFMTMGAENRAQAVTLGFQWGFLTSAAATNGGAS